MLTKRKKFIVLTLGIALVIASISWHVYAKMQASKSQWGKMPPTPVEITVAKSQSWQQKIQATGTLMADEGVMLKSEAAGRVTRIYFHSGQTVKAGDPLVDINPAVLQARLNAAKAKADLTRGDYKRSIALYKRGVLSKQDFDTAFSNKNTDAANVAAVEAELSENNIRAPFSGRLGLRLFSLGDYINIGQSLVNLQAIDSVYVDFDIPQNDVSQISVGDEVQLHTDALPQTAFSGKVSAIDSAINTNTRTIALRATFPNPHQQLVPGSFVSVTLIAGKATPFITVPAVAVVYDANGNYVYTVSKGHAVKTPVRIVKQSNTEVALSDGLKAGDEVITAGQLKITDGAPVMPMPEVKPASGV